LFFAFNAGSGDAAVWAINDLWLRTCLTDTPLREDSLRDQITIANKQLKQLHDSFKGGGTPDDDSRPNKLILMIEPTRQIQRLAAQQGLFLMQLDLHSPFIDNLRECPSYCEDSDPTWFGDTKKHVKKIVFTAEAKRVGLRELRKMNISAENLFPGIDGFAKSLSHTVIAT
jgi:hypothetical protein